MFLSSLSFECSNNCLQRDNTLFYEATNYVSRFVLNVFCISNLQSEGISEQVIGESTITN